LLEFHFISKLHSFNELFGFRATRSVQQESGRPWSGSSSSDTKVNLLSVVCDERATTGKTPYRQVGALLVTKQTILWKF